MLASYVFYAWGAMNFLWFLIFLTAVNYFSGFLVAHSRYGKMFLILGIVFEILALGYFKYSNFLVEQLNGVREYFGFLPAVWKGVVLPLGISFFTFHGISYLIDVYKKHTPPEKNFANFALYICFFPQLIAGPIVRYHEIAHQIKSREHSFDKFFEGVFSFCCGLAMKVLLANQIAGMSKNLVKAGSSGIWQTSPASSVLILLGLCFAMQVYYDFAGYSKMAIGLGKMVGLDFPMNFNRPYIATSVMEFWRRWHISLMNFLREYVYFPLGGSRVSLLKNCRNIMIVFLLSGIWHGANWTFIAWGIYFGFWLMFEKLFEEKFLSKIPKIIRWFTTFAIVFFGWIIFDATTLSDAWVNFVKILSFDFSDFPNIAIVTVKEWLFFSAAVFLAFFPENVFVGRMGRFVIVKGILAISLFFYSVLQLAAGGFNPFIYFRF